MVELGHTTAPLSPLDWRGLAGFAVRCAALLALLLAPWPGLGEAYGHAATVFGNAVLAQFESARVAMEFVTPPATAFTTELRASLLAGGQGVRVPIELRTLAFIPTAAFIALSLAEDLPHRRRIGLRLLVGLGALQLFLIFSLIVPLLLLFAAPEPLHLIELDRPVHWGLTLFYRSLVAPPGMIYVVPFSCWWLLRTSYGRSSQPPLPSS